MKHYCVARYKELSCRYEVKSDITVIVNDSYYNENSCICQELFQILHIHTENAIECVIDAPEVDNGL